MTGIITSQNNQCHPEPFGVAQDKLREGSKVPRHIALTELAML